MEENKIKIIENKKEHLECGKCEYGYDGTFSGRVLRDDIFLHDGFLWMIVSCEGCRYSKILKLQIKENFDIKSGYPMNYIHKRYERSIKE